MTLLSPPAPRRRLVRVLQAAAPLVLLVALVQHLGTAPFARSLHVLAPGPIAAALLLGLVTTVAQAQRWRTVTAGIGDGGAAGLTAGRAVQEVYRSALLNAVLPGGVLGDAVRAWRQRAPRRHKNKHPDEHGHGSRSRRRRVNGSGNGDRGGHGNWSGLRASAQAVIGERLAGTTLLLAAVAAVTLPLAPWVSGAALAGAGVAGVVAAPALRRLTGRDLLAVGVWSLLVLAALVTKFAVAAGALGTVPGARDVVPLALIMLIGMSVPVGIGGFGPREAVTAVGFAAVGLSADAGVATAAGYGVLAGVSALPGVLVMLLDLRPATEPDPTGADPVRSVQELDRSGGIIVELPAAGTRHRVTAGVPEATGRVRPATGGQVQLEADVLAEPEPARRSA